MSKRPGIPSLAGREPDYLLPAMKAYVSGERKHAFMKAVLTGAPDSELDRFAKHYAGRSCHQSADPVDRRSEGRQGRGRGGGCAGCHGDDGVSQSPEFPTLAAQDAQYLANAIRAYKDGSRTNETMKGMAEAIEDSAINDIASYYASLPPKPAPEKSTANEPPPSLVKNAFLTSLDVRAATNIVAFYRQSEPAAE